MYHVNNKEEQENIQIGFGYEKMPKPKTMFLKMFFQALLRFLCETNAWCMHGMTLWNNDMKKPVSRQNQPMLLFNPLHIKTFFSLFSFVFYIKLYDLQCYPIDCN